MTERRSILADVAGFVMVLMVITQSAFAALGTSDDLIAAKKSEMWRVPEGAMAYWAFDPTRFGSGFADDPVRMGIEATLRSLVSSRLFSDEDTSSMLAAVLASSVVGSVPHRLVVLDFKAHSKAGAKGGMAIDHLEMVLELYTPGDHRGFLRTIRSIVVDSSAGQQKSSQRAIELGDGSQGVAFSMQEWPAWREISWASRPGVFYVALGRGALAHWLSMKKDQLALGLWQPHRKSVLEDDAKGEVVFEAFCNINALRHGFPEAFGDARPGRLLRAWKLINARSVMFHARWIESAQSRADSSDDQERITALLAAEITWSARSRPVDEIGKKVIAMSSWPGDEAVGLPMPPGSYVAVLPVEWRWLFDLGKDSYRAGLKPWDAIEHEHVRKKWMAANYTKLKRLLASAEPWLVLSDYPRPPIAAPGVTTVYIPLKDEVSSVRFERDMTSVLSAFSDLVDAQGDDQLWSLRVAPRSIDPAGLLRVLSWGLAGGKGNRVLVGGWGQRAVSVNRKWLGDEEGKAEPE